MKRVSASARGFPATRRAKASRSRASKVVCRVTSSPIATTGVAPTPPNIRNTMRAASGSCQMLNSAAGVTLPDTPNAPPMMTNCLRRRGRSGSRITASATLVKGPVATSVSLPGLAFAAARIASTPWAVARRFGRLGQRGIAEAALAVDDAGVGRGGRKRRRRAGPDGNVGTPGERQHGPRVARRRSQRDVADDRRDAEDLAYGGRRRRRAGRARRRCRCRRRRREGSGLGSWAACYERRADAF